MQRDVYVMSMKQSEKRLDASSNKQILLSIVRLQILLVNFTFNPSDAK